MNLPFITIRTERQRSPFDTSLPAPLRFCIAGWVAEWTKALVLKTSVGETLPWVRIPPHPLRLLALHEASLAGKTLVFSILPLSCAISRDSMRQTTASFFGESDARLKCSFVT